MAHHPVRSSFLACALITAVTGCGRERAGPGAMTVDSAGLTIVDNAAPVWSAGAEWHIDAAPAVDLGGDGSNVAFERIAGVAFLPGGGLIVGDEGASRVYAFDAAGSPRWRVGRAGDGPGEFRLIASLGIGPADSVWVFDFGRRRFTILTAGGAVTRTVDIAVPVSSPRAVGRLADGSFIIQELWGSPGDDAGTGMRRDPAAIIRVSADGASVDTLAIRAGREVWITVENGRGVMNTPLFSRNTVAATDGRRIAVGDQAAFAIDILDPDGVAQRSIRIVGLDLSMDADVVRRAIDWALDDVPESERPARRRFLENVPVPPARPAFGRILFAADGGLWVSGPVFDARDTAAWYVFDADGRWLGLLDMPARFEPHAVAMDRVAGVWLDDLDVEHVRVYRVSRPD